MSCSGVARSQTTPGPCMRFFVVVVVVRGGGGLAIFEMLSGRDSGLPDP